MKHAQTLFRSAAAFAGTLAVAMLATSPSVAADIISEWTSVKAPPAPELKPVALDGKTTALLILDMMKGGCTARPRCVATVPNVKKLHDAARAAGAMVFYSLVGDNPTPAEIMDPGFAPREDEWVRYEAAETADFPDELGRVLRGAGEIESHRGRLSKSVVPSAVALIVATASQPAAPRVFSTAAMSFPEGTLMVS